MRRNRGFTKPELAAILVIWMVLLAVFLPRLLRFQAESERGEVDHVVTAMRSALSLTVSHALSLSDGPQRIKALVGSNPMLLLETPPLGYRGEIKGWLKADFPSGSWFYNQKSQSLCYRPKWPEIFDEPDLIGQNPAQLEFMLVAVWNEKQQPDGSVQKLFDGVRLQQRKKTTISQAPDNGALPQ